MSTLRPFGDAMVSIPLSIPASGLTHLASLNQAMAQHLSQSPLYPGLTVTCQEHQGRLLLLAQHRAPEAQDLAALFKALERLLYTVLSTVPLEDSPWEDQVAIPVRLYLRLKAEDRPYAMHTFTWRLAETAAILFPTAPEQATVETADRPGSPDSHSPDSHSPDPQDSQVPDPSPETEAGLDSPASPTVPPSASEDAGVPSPSELAPDDPDLDDPNSLALALWGDPGEAPPQAMDSPGPKRLDTLAQGLRDYWSYGVVGAILVTSGLFATALSRPCVVGRCDRLAQAQVHYDRAQDTLSFSPSPTDLEAAQVSLQQAIDRLAPIPVWSGAYDAARVDLQRYRQEVRAVQAIIRAQAIAARAADLSQNPPHSVERWVTIHQLWRQAIDQLETVPDTSPAFDYAQKKRSEYRANHSEIGRRVVAEEEAEANFNTALQTGLLAQQRMDTANSLAGWQLATKEWQAAIKGLSLIPQGTLIYEQAQAQMRDYQQHLHRTTHQSHLETVSAHNYDQALRAARTASAYEAQGQWSLAVSHWQRAVASAQQIPTGTLLSESGALLLETYEPALRNAQTRLQGAVAIQRLTTTLGTLCADVGGSCTVREEPTQVRIILATPAANDLRQAITPPAANSSLGLTQTLTPQTQALIEQVTTLSHQVNRPVAIYDSQGSFVARYRPDVGGFVRS